MLACLVLPQQAAAQTPPTVNISIGSETVAEDVAGGNATFTVTLSEAVSSDVVLDVTYAAGMTNPATLAADLGSLPDTVTIEDGELTATITVPITDDDIVETDETFDVSVAVNTAPEGVIIGTGTATGIITNDDTAVLGFTGSQFFLPTEGTSFTTTVSFLSSGASSAAVPVTLTWTTVAGSRNPGQPEDLDPSSGTVTILAGQSSADIMITAFDDMDDEPDAERLLIQLGTSTASPLPADVSLVASSDPAYQREVRVVDNDEAPAATVSIGDVSVAEDVEGGNAQFTVTLSAAQAQNTILDLTFEPGDTNPATPAADLGTLPTIANVRANTLSATFNVPIVDDDLVEGDETFTVTIMHRSGNPNLTITKGTAIGTIEDDDVAAVAPAITTQPTDRSVTVGDDATFTVVATGTPAPTYQWRKDGTAISGATSETLTISGATLADAGEYTVVVSNTAGNVTSNAATLTVTAAAVAPQITTQPADRSVTVGEDATFTVVATGTPAPTYQWRKDGTAISGATSETLTISGASVADAGEYTVVVSNTAGTVTSNAATLTVTPAAAPDLTVDDVSVSSASVVESASFTINATVNNEGNAASAATTLTYYRSADATITTGDTSIATDPIGMLAANGSSTQDASVSIATAGTYWVGACVPTVSGETNADNNCSTGVQVVVTDEAAAPPTVAISINEASSASEGEAVRFTVSLSAALLEPRTLDIGYTAGTGDTGAGLGDLDSARPTTLTLPIGTTSVDLVVPTVEDDLDEENETFTVTLSLPDPPADPMNTLTIADGDGEGTINDDDTATISIADQTRAENEAFRFRITTTGARVGSAVNLTWTATDGPGDRNIRANVDLDLDLSSPTAAITLPASTGSDRAEVFLDIPIEDDNIHEFAETFTITLTANGALPNPNVRFVTASSSSATGTINDNEGPSPTINISNADAVAENAGSATFMITLSDELSRDAVLNVAYAAGMTNPATPAADLGSDRPATVTIPEGDTEATLTVPITNDALVEGDETFDVTLTTSTGGVTIGDGVATGTITNDDTAEVSLSSTPPPPAAEGGTITFTVELDNPVAEAFSLGWTASNGTATVLDDLDEQSGTVDIAANSRTATFTITVASDDEAEGSETFTVALTGAPTGLVNIAPSRVTVDRSAATGTISASDATPVAPQITTQPADRSVTVGDDATFAVVATGTPAPTYQWRKDGTAIAGATDASYTVSGASVADAGEYTVVVSNTAGTVTSNAATLTVTAATGDISIDLSAVGDVSEAANRLSFRVDSTEELSQAVTVAWEVTGGTTSEADFRQYASSGTATIEMGEDVVRIRFIPEDDDIVEGPETLELTISEDRDNPLPEGVTIGTAMATGTLTDDDDPPPTVAPQITTQPTDRSVTVGDDATFTVVASGTPTPTYQWRKDGTAIAGATDASYTVSGATLADAGSYTVVVSNTAGNVTSDAATLTVTAAPVAPQITTQPADRSVTVGDDATFTVVATGTPAPTYQWRKDGTAISGATSETLTISGATVADAGEYTVVVSNTAAAVTSNAATLTVTTAAVAPQITTQPADRSVTVGDDATFAVVATGTPTPTYQWRKDGTDISGATSETLTISGAALADAGSYTVVVTNTAGNVTSNAATLTVTAAAVAPQITTQPVNRSVTVGDDATFAVVATGTPAPTYQWHKDGSDISGATSETLTISGASLADAGEYTVVVSNTAGNVTSNAATLTVTAAAVAPQITTQPVNRSVTVGDDATFAVVATGTPTPTYQWRKDGTAIAGATDASYTISGATLADAGEYTVVVSNTAGNVTSDAATLTVTAAAVAPQITTQPADRSVTVGDDATFAVVATGTPAPTYQWRKDGTAIAGATSETLTISGATVADAGEYTVVVSNTAGNVTSNAATLTVTAAAVAPQITTQPADRSVTVGDDATFTVVATGTPTPTYQWRKDGTDISGATDASYTVSGATVADAGEYTVVVSNTAGIVTSNAATLTVTAAAVAPQITTQPTDRSVTVGDDATFAVVATGTPTPTYQWRKDGTAISGATSETLTISGASVADAGEYTVVVSNTAGTVTSNAATLTVNDEAAPPASKLSVLIEPRLIGAGTALRRHVNRFDSVTGTVVRNRLDGRAMKTLTASQDLGSGAVAVGGSFDQNHLDQGHFDQGRWGAWIDGAWAGFDGKATGYQADVYGGFDFLGGNGKWLIGALIGHEVADLEIGRATYRSQHTHVGLYGGARLWQHLLFDGAVTYGRATPDIALGDVSASHDANRITARGALTGDFGLDYGLWTGSVRIEPQLGLLYSRERLGAFTDSAGGVGQGETLELGRFSAGPRLTWAFDGGRLTGGARMQWDFLELEDGVDGRVSGAADIGVTFDLAPNITLGVQGDVDGIGIGDDFGSLGGTVELKARF